jgi:enoyl-CoA hydratase/carnithine racemase
MEALGQFKSLNVTIVNGVGNLELNRPEKSNAFDQSLWEEFSKVRHS